MKTLINGIEWGIKEVDSNDSMLLVSDKRCNGTVHYLHQEMYLNNGLKQDTKHVTLRHELTHAFLYETQIDSKENYTEEMVCEFVGMYGKLITNIADDYFKKGE